MKAAEVVHRILPKLTEVESKEALKERIIQESSGDLKIAHLALKALKKETTTPEVKKFILQTDQEIVSILQRPISKSLEYVSPHSVSLQEGELPLITKEHREAIKGYLTGETSLAKTLESLSMNPRNYKDILKSIKIIDLELDRLSLQERDSLNLKNTTYALRTICLQASEGVMPSYEAYTKYINPEFFENPFSLKAREYAAHEYNYVPERVRDHLRVLHDYGVEMMGLSKRMKSEGRVFYCIGGNTAVGKSRCAKTDEEFKKGLVNEEIVGALNPDTVKAKLRKDVAKVTNQQIHVEGFAIAQKLSLELRNKALRASVVIDERLGVPKVVDEIVQTAQETNAIIKYKDIDGPLLISCLRVLGRNPAVDPCVPFGPIAGGYKVIRQNREEVIENMVNNPRIESYQLFVSDDDGSQNLVAEKRDGVFIIFNKKLYQRALEVPTDTEINQVQNQIITPQFIAQAAQFPGVSAKALTKYIGMTISQALEAHSKELP